MKTNKISLFIIIILFLSCSRPLYIKDKHFDCTEKNYTMDTDLKELIYKSLQRAVVVKKDIPDYRLIWKKHRIYVLNEYHSNRMTSQKDWIKGLTFLSPNEIPNKIENVKFCIKSKESLQKISNKTWEDFLYLSFNLIFIDGDTATIEINTSWNVSKHSKKVYLSGGGYTCIYKKINGEWKFEKIISSWIS